MAINDFYIKLDYTDVVDLRQGKSVYDVEDLSHLGVDKVYFSGDYPAILFKEVKDFSDGTLKQIAKIHHLAWNYRKVMFLFVISPFEIRIYNCNTLPFNYESENIDIANELERIKVVSSSLEDEALENISAIFSRVGVDSGTLWATENDLREKVDQNQRIDKYLVKSLLNTAQELKLSGLSDEIIHSLLMRSIFLMYLEDKGAAKETNLYNEILPGVNSFLEILNSKPATYSIFRKLEEHFNGNVFPVLKNEEMQVDQHHLKIIKQCLYDGDLDQHQSKLFTNWRLFRFDIIQIELLSEIYEHFLEEFKESKKEEGGQYYTPPSLVELILNEKLKINGETNWQVRVLDPACGSGIFLVETYKRLVKRWKNANPDQQIKFSELKKILQDNIFGIELDPLAIRVTAFSLYLALVEHLNPKTLWIDKRYKFPYLIYDPKDKSISNQGKNLFRQDTIGEVDPSAFGKIDLVVGNPPFGSKIKLGSIKKYCMKYSFGKDMVIPFLHKAAEFAGDGSVVLIFNTKILTNTEKPFQNFRQWLFNSTYVEKLYNFSIFRKTPQTFGGQLFSSAVGPVSIVFYQNNAPKVGSPTIEYWAPKTYVKNSLVEGVVIDSTDIKFLPREECRKPDTKIWKVAMWGSMEDYKLISRLNDLPKLKNLFKRKILKKGVGLQFLNASTTKIFKDTDIPKLPYVKPGGIKRYWTPNDVFTHLVRGLSVKALLKYREYYTLPETKELKSIDVFRRLGTKEVFYGPHILIKSGLSDKEICASYIEEDCSFNDKVLGINGGTSELLKSVTTIINSRLATYFLFLISASIGIEREEIKPNEVYELPFINEPKHIHKLAKLFDLMQFQIESHYPMKVGLKDFEEEAYNEIAKLLSLSTNEMILIEDFMSYTLPMIFEGHKSLALLPTSLPENKRYASTLSFQLNSFLQQSDFIINASVYDVQRYSPLNIIKISFDKVQKDISEFGSEVLLKYINTINSFTLTTLSKSIYIQKQLKYFDNNVIYIIKPNQRRFWSRSSAINDAKELISEILKM